MKTCVFKLYRSKRNRNLHQTINVAGCIWNHLIALHKRYYRRYKKGINLYRIQKHITKLKKLPRFAFWNSVGSQAIQDIAERIDKAYRLFFRNLKHKVKSAPPKFKAVRKYRSFTLKQFGWKLLHDNRVLIQGKEYRYFKSRDIDGKIKTVTIKRDAVGDLWLFFVVESENALPEARPGEIVGLDFGLKTFLTTSKGYKLQSPLFFAKNLSRIKRLAKNVSWKTRGSNKRKKCGLALARAYRKTDNQRRDFHFKLARSLALEYAVIAVEDLNLKAMQKIWGKKVSDLGFAQFLNILEWECKKHGSRLVKIDRFQPSSKTCSDCGHKLAKLDLSERLWTCPACGCIHDRDVNAAINIERVGASTLSGESVKPANVGSFC